MNEKCNYYKDSKKKHVSIMIMLHSSSTIAKTLSDCKTSENVIYYKKDFLILRVQPNLCNYDWGTQTKNYSAFKLKGY